jgi:hypothetical protein
MASRVILHESHFLGGGDVPTVKVSKLLTDAGVAVVEIREPVERGEGEGS